MAVKKTGADLFIWITDRFWPIDALREWQPRVG